mmetsp:Transcript_23989/g.46069  ORF Transcript_23989/g.46069 Transcript_23989/m.46069 type:complete len:168 (-) Transcript_23989:7-510(-)
MAINLNMPLRRATLRAANSTANSNKLLLPHVLLQQISVAAPITVVVGIELRNHDVWGWRRSNVTCFTGFLTRLCPASLWLATKALIDAPEGQQRSPKDEPGPTQHDVPVIFEKVQDHGKEGEHASCTNDDETEDHGCQAPLTFAHHGYRALADTWRTSLNAKNLDRT